MLKLDLNLNELKKILIKNKAKRFMLELPEGLKHKCLQIVDELKDTKKEFVLNIDTTFGACDIYENDLKKADCQAIIHFGHTKFVLNKIKERVIYWPCYYSFDIQDIEKIVKDIEKYFSKKKITIVGPIQYEKFILKIIKELKRHKKLDIILGKQTNRLKTNQILGCDCSSIQNIINKLYTVIYLGDGNFHFNALQNTKAYKYNFKGQFELIEDIKKPNYSALFLEAKVIGIYVSSKLGQNRIKLAQELAQKIKKIKKEPILLYGNEINSNKLIGLGINFLINTACPRIFDDYKNYYFPIINYSEFLVLCKRHY
ncbi:MAG: hypothetical protein COT14_02490 [Candidatus Diapherotrites archaeon CG08_land_8_20_14_0_20_30_16]|nr:MAG: hypothetical protein COT14_02490 [Candidatus Diapherotrites archaeon CG08_land_8_20_14_0_20_30_16]